jgi:hypothetical protein
MHGVSAPGVPSIDCLQVLFQCYSMVASKFARSSLPSSSSNLLIYSLQTRSIMASKSISNLPRLWPPCLHDHGLQVYISKLTQLQPPRASPNLLDYSLQDRTTIASKCIHHLTESQSRSSSKGSLDCGLEVNLQIHLIAAS